jgi:hypothetical protein
MLAPGHTPVCRRSRVSPAQPPNSVSRRPCSCGTRVRRAQQAGSAARGWSAEHSCRRWSFSGGH